MNIFSITIFAVCSIIYYIDFVYILKYKTYYFKKGKDGKKVLAKRIDALLSFIVATVALSRIILNFFTIPDIVSTIYFFVLLLLLIITTFRGKWKF